MVRSEGYREGVSEVVRLARRVAEALDRDRRPTRTDFASAALRELADAAEEMLLGEFAPRQEWVSADKSPSLVSNALNAIKALAGDHGEIECPACKGRLHWLGMCGADAVQTDA